MGAKEVDDKTRAAQVKAWSFEEEATTVEEKVEGGKAKVESTEMDDPQFMVPTAEENAEGMRMRSSTRR